MYEKELKCDEGSDLKAVPLAIVINGERYIVLSREEEARVIDLEDCVDIIVHAPIDEVMFLISELRKGCTCGKDVH